MPDSTLETSRNSIFRLLLSDAAKYLLAAGVTLKSKNTEIIVQCHVPRDMRCIY